QVKQETAAAIETDLSAEDNDDNVVLEETSEDSEAASGYDVILQVKPEKVPQIKSQIIDGQKCIVIPVDENELTKVNGLDNLI
ncbi:MAG: DUF4317 family protein, partial [Clostridiaceae bacterium]